MTNSQASASLWLTLVVIICHNINWYEYPGSYTRKRPWKNGNIKKKKKNRGKVTHYHKQEYQDAVILYKNERTLFERDLGTVVSQAMNEDMSVEYVMYVNQVPSASLTCKACVSYIVLTSLLVRHPTNSQSRAGERPQLPSHKGISHGR